MGNGESEMHRPNGPLRVALRGKLLEEDLVPHAQVSADPPPVPA
jgi:hypothetical protein